MSYDGDDFELNHGDVVIAAITSCTNTSNPAVMIGAGLVARKARALGLNRKPWVKTSLAPGSKVVTDYLDTASLTRGPRGHRLLHGRVRMHHLHRELRPIARTDRAGVEKNDLVVASVLSGNRNFEGRIQPHVKANYLASPPLVVAYALAGTVDIDLTTEPLGADPDGNAGVPEGHLANPERDRRDRLDSRSRGNSSSNSTAKSSTVPTSGGQSTPSERAIYAWNDASTYIQEPPFFEGLTTEPDTDRADHRRSGPAQGWRFSDDRSHLTGRIDRRRQPGRTVPDRPRCRATVVQQLRLAARQRSRHDARDVRQRPGPKPNRPGHRGRVDHRLHRWNRKERFTTPACHTRLPRCRSWCWPARTTAWGLRGTGPPRARSCWASRRSSPRSYERIHRSNLVGMGVLPLTFRPGQNAETLGLDGTETFSIVIDDSLEPRQDVEVTAARTDGSVVSFTTTCRIDTPVEVDYYRNGGILHTVLKAMAAAH